MLSDSSSHGPQDLVVTMLGAYARPRHRRIWSGGLVAVLGEFGYSPGASRVALTRLAARDVITSTRSGRHAYYAATQRTMAVLDEGDARIFSFGTPRPPDDEWTVVWHTVPDDRKGDRGRLIRRLRFLGFGPMQDGTWIAPRNHASQVSALLDDMALRDHVVVWLGRPATDGDLRGLATRVWDVDELDASYRAFVRNFGTYTDSESRAHGLDDRTAFNVRTRLVHAFRRFPGADPELPESLVTSPPHRADAVRLFHDLYDALAAPSQRHFDRLTTRG